MARRYTNWDGVSYSTRQPTFARRGGATRCAICGRSKPDEPVITLEFVKRFGIERPRVHNSCAVTLMKTGRPVNPPSPKKRKLLKWSMAAAVERGEVSETLRYRRPPNNRR